MLHPASELRRIGHDPRLGQGVFATASIPRGTVVWVLDDLDRILTEAAARALPPLLRAALDRFAYVDAAGDRVLCWDLARYMNHSCAPSTRSVGLGIDVCVRDLAPGDEITCEYAVLNSERPLACRCGAAACRGTVRASDLERFAERWDAEAAAALALAPSVAQPLLAFARVLPGDEALYGALVRGEPARPRSCREFGRASAPAEAP